MKYTLSAKGVKWVHVTEPQPEELAAFVRETNITLTDAESVVRGHLRPEIIVSPDYLLFMILVPVFDTKTRVTAGIAVYIIVRDATVFSLHFESLPVMDHLRSVLEHHASDEESFFDDNPLSFAFYIIDSLYESAFRKVDRLGNHIDIAEDAVFQGNERKMVEEVSLLVRDVMDFRKIIRPQKELFATLVEHPLVTATTIQQWRHAHYQLQRLWESLENLYESVKGLSRTNQTLIQEKENELLRLLMLYSIVTIPVLLLVGPYYNLRLPTATFTDVVVFWIVFGALLLALVFIVVRARKKRVL